MEQISHGLCLRLLDQLWRNPEEAGHCVSALSLAASKGNADAVWALLELGAEVDMPVGKYGLTALIKVSELSQLFPCVKSPQELFRSVSTQAVEFGSVKTVELLLENGADANFNSQARK